MISQPDPWPEPGDPDPEGAEPAAFDAAEPETGIERSRPKKAATAFRTISEVADDLHVPQHVLRFWETRFPQVKPLKRGGGRRYYRPDDVVLLRRISDLLYVQGYTVKGVQRLLVDGGLLRDELPSPEQVDPDPGQAGEPAAMAPPRAASQPPQPAENAWRRTLGEILTELEAMRRMLPGGG